jgi:hypothetical protein
VYEYFARTQGELCEPKANSELPPARDLHPTLGVGITRLLTAAVIALHAAGRLGAKTEDQAIRDEKDAFRRSSAIAVTMERLIGHDPYLFLAPHCSPRVLAYRQNKHLGDIPELLSVDVDRRALHGAVYF